MAVDARSESVDAGVCRDHLGALLTEESDALGELEELLQREHEVLGARNVPAIERTALIRQQMIGALARTEEQRRALCTMHGYSPDWVGLECLMAWCDPECSLLSRLRECAQSAARCRDLNDRNGTLVAAQLKHVEGLLAVLTGGANQSVTYGPKWAATSIRFKRELGAA